MYSFVISFEMTSRQSNADGIIYGQWDYSVACKHINKTVKLSVRINVTLEVREIFLSFHMILSLVRAAVVWTIVESISGLEPSLEMTDPKYLKFSNSSNRWHFIYLSLKFTRFVCHHFRLVRTCIHFVYFCCCIILFNIYNFICKAEVVLSWYSSASIMILSRKMFSTQLALFSGLPTTPRWVTVPGYRVPSARMRQVVLGYMVPVAGVTWPDLGSMRTGQI